MGDNIEKLCHKKLLYVVERRPFTAKAEADKALKEFDEVANELGISHFLWGGTCLGIVRDGTWLEVDEDIDMGINCSKDDEKKFFEKLVEKGFIRRGSYGLWRYGLKFDVYSRFNRGLLDNYLCYLEKLETVEYGGNKYPIPSPVDGFLSKKYGKDWRIKKPYWKGGFFISEKEGDIYLVEGDARLEDFINEYNPKGPHCLLVVKKGCKIKKLTKAFGHGMVTPEDDTYGK